MCSFRLTAQSLLLTLNFNITSFITLLPKRLFVTKGSRYHKISAFYLDDLPDSTLAITFSLITLALFCVCDLATCGLFDYSHIITSDMTVGKHTMTVPSNCGLDMRKYPFSWVSHIRRIPRIHWTRLRILEMRPTGNASRDNDQHGILPRQNPSYLGVTLILLGAVESRMFPLQYFLLTTDMYRTTIHLLTTTLRMLCGSDEEYPCHFEDVFYRRNTNTYNELRRFYRSDAMPHKTSFVWLWFIYIHMQRWMPVFRAEIMILLTTLLPMEEDGKYLVHGVFHRHIAISHDASRSQPGSYSHSPASLMPNSILGEAKDNRRFPYHNCFVCTGSHLILDN